MMRQVKPEFKVGDIVRIVEGISDVYSYNEMRCFVEEVISEARISLYSLDSPLTDRFGYSGNNWYVGDFKPSDLEKIGEMSESDVEEYDHYIKTGDRRRILETIRNDKNESESNAWKS